MAACGVRSWLKRCGDRLLGGRLRGVMCPGISQLGISQLGIWCLALGCRARRDGWIRTEPLPERPLVAVAAAVAAGCAAPILVPASPVMWWFCAVAALAAWGWAVRAGRPARAAVWLLVGGFASAAGWSTVSSSLFAADDLAWSLTESPQPVAVEGVVLESPRLLMPQTVDPLRSDTGRAGGPRCHEFVLAVRAVRDGPVWRPASGRAAVILDGHGSAARESAEREAAMRESGDRGGPAALLSPGTRVRLLGRGLRPSSPLNPGEFDFRDRARSLRCLSIVRTHEADGVAVIAGPAPVSVAAILDRLRGRGVRVLHEHLSDRRAALAAALLLGARESLPREDTLEFLVTGTIHVLSISGLHVGLLSLALFRMFHVAALPRGWSLAAVACFTGLYMTLVGAETPVVRATLLVWLACLGAAVGRPAPAANSLALAGGLVLAWHPQELFRTGTQLSFLSTAVLVAASAAVSRPACVDPIERLIDRSRSPWERRLRRMARQAWNCFLIGTAVWAVTAPIVAARFHLFSPIGLVVNPLIAPLVALAMAWGFVCLATSAVSPGLAAASGWACDATLESIAIAVSWAARVPGGYCWVAGPPGWWVAGWYVAVVAMLLVMPRERLVRVGTWAALAVAWCGIGLASSGAGRLVAADPPALRVVVAAMGHGCGILVRSPTGRCLLYDAGRLGAAAAARRGMAAVLWHEGIGRIDTLVISHADADHFNAVPELLERFTVGEIVVARSFLESSSPAVADLLDQARAAGIPVRLVRRGDSFAVDPLCRVRVLHPQDAEPGGWKNDNEASLVLAVESAGRRLLLTGDLEGEPLRRLVAANPGTCDVLIAPHHGSRTSLPPDIARVTAADWVIVSGPGTAAWDEIREAYATARADGQAATVIKTGCDAAPGGAIALELTAATVGVRQFVAGVWRPVEPEPHSADVRAIHGPRSTGTLARGRAQPVAAKPTGSLESGRVSAQPAAMITSWLTTKPARSSSTPLVKP
jgi:competence protein ComEC